LDGAIRGSSVTRTVPSRRFGWHGESQGAFGAIDQEGNPLAALAAAQYNDGNVETTSRSWAYDLDATRLTRCTWTTRY
jgi:hypothetical protein